MHADTSAVLLSGHWLARVAFLWHLAHAVQFLPLPKNPALHAQVDTSAELFAGHEDVNVAFLWHTAHAVQFLPSP